MDGETSARPLDGADRRRRAIAIGVIFAVAVLVAIAVVFLAVRGSEQAWITAQSITLDPTNPDDVDVDPDADAANADANGGTASAQAPIKRAAIDPSKATVTLSGFVRNVTGAEPVVPECELTFEVGGKINKVFVASGQRYRVNGIPSGHARVRISADRFETLIEERDIREAPPEQFLNFSLRPLESLRVRLVAPNGKSLLDALHSDGSFASPPELNVVATKELPDSDVKLREELASADHASVGVVDQDFDHLLAQLAPRGWSDASAYTSIVFMPEALPLHLSVCRSTRVLCTQIVNAGTKDLDLVVALDAVRASNGSAHFRIVDATDDSPLADARARLIGIDAERRRSPYAVGGPRQPVADDELERVGGDAVVRDLDPGAYKLAVGAPHHEQLLRVVRIEPGATTELGTVRLARETVIEGTVVYDRAPVPNATVDLFPMIGDGAANDFVAEGCRTDAQGNFRFEHAGARAYLLYVRSKVGVSPSMPLDASDGATHHVDVRLTGGAPITIRLDETLQAANHHGSEYSIRIVDERKFPILDSSLPDSGSTQIALAPGSYSLLTRYRKLPIVEQSFEVGPSAMDVIIAR